MVLCFGCCVFLSNLVENLRRHVLKFQRKFVSITEFSLFMS